MKWLLAFLLLVTPVSANDWGLFASVDKPSFDILGIDDEPTAPIARNEDLGPDRLVIMYADWCPNCPRTMQSSLEGLSKMVGAHKGWSFGNTDDRMIQFVDADEHPRFTESLNASLDGKLAFPFLGKIEGNEVVRTWENGCTEPLDQWTLGWLYKGENERPRTVTKLKATVKETGGYPLRGSWWSVDGRWRPDRTYLVNHLKGGEHRGKFDHGWLDSLSYAELMSLHSDDHEGRAKRTGRTAIAKAQTVTTSRPVSQPVRYQSSCPNGNCPVQTRSRGFFRRR